jgi:hypothetical protein
MTNGRLPYPGFLLALIAFIVVRQALGGQPVFRSEFVVEDFILLLTLAFGLAPSRFKPLIWRLITCSMNITMALIAWKIGVRKFTWPQTIVSTFVFALLATHSAVLTMKEVSKLRKEGVKGAPPA